MNNAILAADGGTSTLPPLVPLPFLEAIAYAKARGVELPSTYYGSLQGLARAMAFSVAGLTKLDQVQAVKDSLDAALETGESFGEWKKRVTAGDEPILDLPEHRIETIFRTNLQGAYNRGRCEQQAAAVDSHPWYMLDAVNDSRTRPSHAAMDGKVARHDDPWWNTHTPSNGYRCRCRRLALTDKQATQFQRADAKRMQDPEAAAARATAKPDPGWDYNIGDAPMAGIERAIEQRSGPLADVMREELAKKPAWPMFDAGTVTLDDIKTLGSERFDELMALVTPDDREKIAAMRDRGKSIADLEQEAAYASDLLGVIPWWREAILGRLAEVRTMGGTLPISNKSGKGKAIADRVAKKLPSDWINKLDPDKPYKIKFKEGARGWHDGYRKEIQAPEGSTAEHEFIHAIQRVAQEIDALFQEEHKRRTAGEDLAHLGDGYGRSEKGRRDKYIDKYFGKEYEHGGALELMTMTYQALLGGDAHANRLLSELIFMDKDLLRLALGILFHVR